MFWNKGDGQNWGGVVEPTRLVPGCSFETTDTRLTILAVIAWVSVVALASSGAANTHEFRLTLRLQRTRRECCGSLR